MNIKQVENETGLDRGNIYFYEKEELICPRRQEGNKYRDYSDEDVELLLKIKLLRSLHVSLEDIRKIIRNEESMADVLDFQIRILEREQKVLTDAIELCRQMQSDRIPFWEMNTVQYLQNLENRKQNASEEEKLWYSLEGDRIPLVPHPWKRFLARTLDMLIYEKTVEIVVMYGVHKDMSQLNMFQNGLTVLGGMILMILLEPFLLYLLGTTPGKAIFGLKLENEEGGHIPYFRGMLRTLQVLCQGMAFQVPFVSMLCLYTSYHRCKWRDPLPWDEKAWDGGTVYRMQKSRPAWVSGILCVMAAVAFCGLMLLTTNLQIMAPNKGRITLEEYAENFNYYMDYLTNYETRIYMDEEGVFQNREESSPAIISGELRGNPKQVEKSLPEFEYIVEDGILKEVFYRIEIKPEDLADMYYLTGGAEYMPMIFAALGTQWKTFFIQKELIKVIWNCSFDSWEKTVGKVQIFQEAEYTGYYKNGEYPFIVQLISNYQDESKRYYCRELHIILP